MRRLTFLHLFVIGLMVWLAGQLTSPAAASPALGFTSTPVPPATDTSAPPPATNTPAPLATDTLAPPATGTSVPPATGTPAPTTPTPTREPSEKPGPIVVDPVITKLVSVQLAQVGDPVQFTITAFNPNAVEVRSVVVVDPLPPEVDYLSATTTQGSFFYSANTHTLTFDLGALAAGQTATMVIQTRVNALGQPQQEVRNTATLWVSGRNIGDSGAGAVQLIPGQIPEAGIGPAPSRSLTWLLAAFAALLPLAGWQAWRRWRSC